MLELVVVVDLTLFILGKENNISNNANLIIKLLYYIIYLKNLTRTFFIPT